MRRDRGEVLGAAMEVDAELGVPDEEKSLSEGAVAPGQVIRSGNRTSRSGPEASRTTESTQTECDAA
ncbi:hypothetical protein OG568_10890 [Streptomyces sp. NBC_01450]|uniref:hypothetical protein n=1 Tax=Streptomyces sp. NBC_01450 TaxID=2903871 RepID=UPI002E31C6F0|nr:hypothetical protein [Streptomyces sp. NBC_01450]